MAFCIPKSLVNEFLDRIKSGEITPDKMLEMTSEERNKYFASFLGDMNAQKVNALFESKVLLQNQQQGIINWAEKVADMKPSAKKDILSKVQRMTNVLDPKENEAFLKDLASQRLGFGVTSEEASNLVDLAAKIQEAKEGVDRSSPDNSDSRLRYGSALVSFKNYAGDLKAESQKMSFIELAQNPSKAIETLFGSAKSIVASFDDSFFGRQGYNTLVNEPDIWAKNLAKSVKDIAQSLTGQSQDVTNSIKAEVYSRENALNGKYEALGIDIGLNTEEAFPVQLSEKIPVLGKLYKASEVAYNGAALRMRADLADRFIKEFEAQGIDVTDKTLGLGRLINSMTGRGAISMTEGQAKFTNAVLFSAKFMKSTLDTMTAHAFDPKVSNQVKMKAVNQLLRIVGFVASVMATSKFLDKDSVELDPRSSNFGVLMYGKNRNFRFDITGGLRGIVVLAAQIAPTIHNGKWGQWRKKQNGEYYNMFEGKYGQMTPKDLMMNFFVFNKASPVAALTMDMALRSGKDYKGDKLTLTGTATRMTVPIAVQNFYDMIKSETASEEKVLTAFSALMNVLGVVDVREPYKKKKKQ